MDFPLGEKHDGKCQQAISEPTWAYDKMPIRHDGIPVENPASSTAFVLHQKVLEWAIAEHANQIANVE